MSVVELTKSVLNLCSCLELSSPDDTRLMSIASVLCSHVRVQPTRLVTKGVVHLRSSRQHFCDAVVRVQSVLLCVQGFVTLQEALVDAVVRLVDRGSGDAFVLVSVFPCLLKRPLWKGFALSCTCTRMFRQIDLHVPLPAIDEGCAGKKMKGVFEHSVGQRVSYTLTLTLTLLTHSPAHCLPKTCFVLCRRSLCLCRIRKRSSMRAFARGSEDAFVLVSVFPCLLKRPLWKDFALSCLYLYAYVS